MVSTSSASEYGLSTYFFEANRHELTFVSMVKGLISNIEEPFQFKLTESINDLLSMSANFSVESYIVCLTEPSSGDPRQTRSCSCFWLEFWALLCLISTVRFCPKLCPESGEALLTESPTQPASVGPDRSSFVARMPVNLFNSLWDSWCFRQMSECWSRDEVVDDVEIDDDVFVWSLKKFEQSLGPKECWCRRRLYWYWLNWWWWWWCLRNCLTNSPDIEPEIFLTIISEYVLTWWLVWIEPNE